MNLASERTCTCETINIKKVGAKKYTELHLGDMQY